MTTVTGSGAAPNGRVTAQMLVVDPATGGRSVIQDFWTPVASDGTWQLSVQDNASFTAVAGTCWDIVCPTTGGVPSRWTVTVPASATPVPIGTCTPVAVARPSIAGALSLVADPAARAVLVGIVKALAAHGLISNNTT